MAYEKTNWEGRVVERPRTFNMQQNDDGTVTLIPAEGKVYKEGTEFSPECMNKIESGIEQAESKFTNSIIALNDEISNVKRELINNIEKTKSQYATGEYVGDTTDNNYYRKIATGFKADIVVINTVGRNQDTDYVHYGDRMGSYIGPCGPANSKDTEQERIKFLNDGFKIYRYYNNSGSKYSFIAIKF